MPDQGVGLGSYAQVEEDKRQRQIDELKALQSQVEQNSAVNVPRGDASAGYGSSAGSFMAGLSSQVSPAMLGGAFAGNSDDPKKDTMDSVGGMGLSTLMSSKNKGTKTAALGAAAGAMGDSGSSVPWSALTGLVSKLFK